MRKYWLIGIAIFCTLAFMSCEKECEECPANTSYQNGSTPIPDIDITGKWMRRGSGDSIHEYITFYQNHYVMESNFTGMINIVFIDGRYGNYTIIGDSLYIWHATNYPNFATIPFEEGIAAKGIVSLHGDTLYFSSKYSVFQDGHYAGLTCYIRCEEWSVASGQWPVVSD